jgi:DNA-binding NarL/FixJ family response regulator
MAMTTPDGQDGLVPTRLLIVDDDARFRALLRMLLEDAPEFDVVGEAHEGQAALVAARELEPDVVLLDVHLPDTTGFDLTPRFAAAGRTPAVVLTSSRGDETYEQLAEQAGASAFVPKHELSVASIRSALK